MENPYLIQRIKYPYNPLEFPPPAGAVGYYGHPKGQCPPDEETRRWVNSALHLDYMGSAEFEFGEVPKALRAMTRIGKEGGLEESELTFEGTASIWTALNRNPDNLPVQTVKAWLLCPKAITKELLPILVKLAEKDIPDKMRLKEVAYIKRGLFGEISRARETKKDEWRKSELLAWLDLDNHWFLTKDKAHLDAVKILIGLPVE